MTKNRKKSAIQNIICISNLKQNTLELPPPPPAFPPPPPYPPRQLCKLNSHKKDLGPVGIKKHKKTTKRKKVCSDTDVSNPLKPVLSPKA